MSKSSGAPRKSKVAVFVRSGCSVNEADIKRLLSDAGLDQEDFVIEHDDSHITELDPIGLTLLVVIDEHVCDDKELEAITRKFSSASSTVIAVFADDFEYQGMHPIAEKYGTQCAWSPTELAEKINAPTQSPPTDTTGSRVRRADAKQVDC